MHAAPAATQAATWQTPRRQTNRLQQSALDPHGVPVSLHGALWHWFDWHVYPSQQMAVVAHNPRVEHTGERQIPRLHAPEQHSVLSAHVAPVRAHVAARHVPPVQESPAQQST